MKAKVSIGTNPEMFDAVDARYSAFLTGARAGLPVWYMEWPLAGFVSQDAREPREIALVEEN